MSKPAEPKQIVYRGDGFWKGIAQYVDSEQGKRIAALLHKPVYTVKEADITYRIANHWESVGLIDSTRGSEKGWRKFSVMDMLLLKILTELRSFGFSLEQLKRVKASLEEQYVHRPSSGEKTTLWEYHVALALAARKPTYLLVFRDGTAEPTYFEQYYASLKHIALADHVHININPLLQLLFPKAAREPLYDQTTEVGADELEALILIRTGNYESVTVKLKNGEIERFEVDEPVDVEKRIVDILQDERYQDIQIKQTDGKIVSIKRTIRKKPEPTR